jgi:D-xylose transport system substrate-binding protein
VYKAIYLEAQDAVALATILRAGLTPPAALVNSTTSPPAGKAGSTQPASLLVPLWVDKTKVASTVVKDGFVDKAALCQAVTAAVCTANGIS